MPPNEAPSDSGGPLEAVLLEFSRAWHAGRGPDPDSFCRRHPECGPELRAAIDDFLFVAEKLPGSDRLNREEPPEDEPDEAVPESRVLGDFRIIREIGRGGMGVVYEAEQVSLRRRVALKILPEHLSFSYDAVKKFRREAEAGGRPSHPGIVAVHAIGEDDEVHYIAHELVDGSRTLADWIGEKAEIGDFRPGQFRELARLVAAVAHAMEHVHAAGVIHRDIKPSNVLLTGDGAPKVTDFGLAKVEDALALSRSGAFAGTPYYMSPEQVSSRRSGIDSRTDIFSLGVTLYEMQTLVRPFEGETSQDVLKKILLQEPQDPRRISARVPRDLATICLKAMEKKPDARYQTMSELAEDLERYQSGDAILARPAGLGTLFWKSVRRNPALSAAVGVAAVAVICLLVFVPYYVVRLNLTIREKNRLSDHARLPKLLGEEATLWPATQERIPLVEDWLTRAETAVDRRALHLPTFETLREKALPYDEEMRRHDRENHPQWAWLNNLRGLKSKIEAENADLMSRVPREPTGEERADGEGGRSLDREKTLALNKERIARLENTITKTEAEVYRRRTWIFEDPVEQWEHGLLAEIVEQLDTLSAGDRSVMARVRRLLSHAKSIHKITFQDHKRDWERAIASISDAGECPQYEGLQIAPQLGLIPIGRDAASGLWEFAHLQTGAICEHGPANELALTEETGLVLVLIPGGTFRMGAEKPAGESELGQPNKDPMAQASESPVHEVTVPPFFLSKYEMTQGQWLRLTGENPSRYGPDEVFGGKKHTLIHPVEQVSWNDCTHWLSRLELRLPSEAEWEYAARGGTTTVWWTGDDKRTLEGAASVADLYFKEYGPLGNSIYALWLNDGFARHAPVNAHRPNPFGLHGTCGNVLELCQDIWERSYEGAPTDGSASIRNAALRYVARGGNWLQPYGLCRSAHRSWADAVHRINYMGVRPARSIE